ncbi:SpoIIE family protein phosphatase [Streptomyces rubiginosohelvolus]
MRSTVDRFLQTLAQELRPREQELTDALVARLRQELPDLWRAEDIAAHGPEAVAMHVAAVLDMNEGTQDPTDAEIPSGGVTIARLLARNGVPISDLLRSYRVGHAELHRQMCEEAVRIAGVDSDLAGQAVLALTEQSFTFVDRTAEHAVIAYQEERERWLRRRLAVVDQASRRIGTTLNVAHTARELVDVGTDHLADLVTVDLLQSVLPGPAGRPPASDSLALRRLAQQSVLEGCPDSAFLLGQSHAYLRGSEPDRVLATGLPRRYNLSTSQLPEWMSASPARREALRTFGIHGLLLVPLWARGKPLGLVQFVRHRTPAVFDEEDLLLAQEIASRAAVSIDNALRYTQERETALTLQRSLLPDKVPDRTAVETAFRYRPAAEGLGVGGDWYDVIPLSGARVALVIGDVVGRGLAAAATMGRLRMAVRTLADIDLMPDELLTHLDDVVIRLQREEDRQPDEISATCLYMVYDPVAGMCSLASAGHLPPAIVAAGDPTASGAPHDTVTLPPIQIGPPLGLGGHPFETAQLEITPGSLIILYTDGVLDGGTRDVDDIRHLLELLQPASSSPEETCDALLSALQPGSPTAPSDDDMALLIAKTRALAPRHVSKWNFPPDPSIVSSARACAGDQLSAWNLEDLSFVTELIVSELVTNAIRYGKEPIQMRLILHSSLICEVSDGSSATPHLRRARHNEEGGRGLLLVAQLADRWGTRMSRSGKVIWTEQVLPHMSDGSCLK